MFVAAAAIAFCTTAAAGAEWGNFCAKGGYIKRVVQGWPGDNHTIGITIKDDNGNLTHWSTSGSGTVYGDAWVRGLLAMALTAYTNQVYVYPTTKDKKCNVVYRARDGLDWRANWEGLIFASSPGGY